ncbi:MAG: H/ACA ribonucleoprotein complex subunit GAR1 [Halobaculum sp.]
MRRVGSVVRVAQRLAVCRVPEGFDGDPPAIGTRVVDESLSEVGEVVDVFGPVARPYVAVSPDDGVALTPLVGQPLYAR